VYGCLTIIAYRSKEVVSVFAFSCATSLEDLRNLIIEDRNNVQSPIRAMYDYNPYEPQEMLRVISLLMQEIKLQY
jgi:hypothetical protein